MTTATPHETTTNSPATAPIPEAETCEALRKALGSCTGRSEFYRTALRALARHFDAPFAALNVDSSSGTLEDHVSHDKTSADPWKQVCDGLLLGARYKGLAIAKLYEASGVSGVFAALALPLVEATGETVGAMVVVTRCDDKSVAKARLSELKALAAMTGAMASSIRSAPPAAPAGANALDHQGVVKAGAYQSLHEFAFAIANNLKSKLGCDQVCLGMARRRSVKMLCMSGLDKVYPRSPGARMIVQAMEECLDAGTILVYQKNSQWDGEAASTGHLLHRRWHQSVGGASVASIPLLADGRPVAVLSLRQADNKPFQRETLEKVSSLAAPLGPGLLLMERANRRLVGQCFDSAARATRRLLVRGAWGRKVLAAALLVLVLWTILGTRSYIVSVPCEVVPAEKRHVAAPFEGTIGAAHVRPGDHVVAGQVLLEMDTKELAIQRERLLAEVNIAELELAHAAMDKDLATAAQAHCKVEIAKAELAVTEHRISRARICAQEDGVVLTGDLFPRVGEVVPLGEPLMELAPCDRWSVELRVPQYAATYLIAGQTGEFTTQARPDQAQPCRLQRVEPSSEIVNGSNVFTAEATLSGPPPSWIRAGMQGTARIDAGKRSVWWVGLHRLIDTVRLQLWKL